MRAVAISPANRTALLAVAVGFVLADSSVVILALPDILVEFDVSIARVAWVLTAFNLVLALCAVPAAYLGRRAPRVVFTTGLVVFGAASAWCAAAGSFDQLLAARCVQAVGGAAVVCAALEVMPAISGSEAAAARTWAVAGALGTAFGPALGGALTQLISWQAIFVAQVPIALVALVLAGVPVSVVPVRAGRPRLNANVALALVSAALTAALFLLVLLLINGWGIAPLGAAVAVSVMPVAAIASGRMSVFHRGPFARSVAGVIAVGCGLAALGLMPGAAIAWTIPPQILVGIGLGLAVGALTEVALSGRSPQAIHGGWTIASRHLGVVAGILVLTPVFVADLDVQQDRSRRSAIAVVLDAPVDPETKIDLARRGLQAIDAAEGRAPDLAPVFADVPPRSGEEAQYAVLRDRLDDQLRRAGTAAVSRSFLFAALFALLALPPLWLARRRVAL